MIILDGKSIKNQILDNIRLEVIKLKDKPKLVVIQVGDDPASCVYVNQKKKMAEYVGYNFEHIKLPESVLEDEVIEIIDKLNEENGVDGILVQMPLPNHLNSKIIQNRIIPSKDVDGLTDINTGKLVHNCASLISCTPKGIVDLLDAYKIEIRGKHAVIVGRSDLVGKPLVNLLLNRDATVSICHSKTKDLSTITKLADILIIAIGKKEFIDESMIKDKSIVIDVGINRVDNKLYGDVKFDTVSKKASYITPVPGGVGPMTIAELAKNVLCAYKINRQ